MLYLQPEMFQFYIVLCNAMIIGHIAIGQYLFTFCNNWLIPTERHLYNAIIEQWNHYCNNRGVNGGEAAEISWKNIMHRKKFDSHKGFILNYHWESDITKPNIGFKITHIFPIKWYLWRLGNSIFVPVMFVILERNYPANFQQIMIYIIHLLSQNSVVAWTKPSISLNSLPYNK